MQNLQSYQLQKKFYDIGSCCARPKTENIFFGSSKGGLGAAVDQSCFSEVVQLKDKTAMLYASSASSLNGPIE